MSELLDRLSNLSPKRLALLVMDLQAKLDEAERRGPEPIAIVGGACRVPGADTLDEFWKLLVEGVDAVGEIPAERFDVDSLFDPDPEAPGKIASRWGGFLEGVDQFDAALFGIAPREAAGIDPQQRLLLEASWEALERAGYAPDSLRGSKVGVFAGLCNGDYGQMLLSGDRSLVDAYTATGNAHSVAAGRVSYVLGLQGPSIAVDTACSSSLVAIHLAVQSLRNGESNLALAGGANVILSPDTTITLSRARMMAPDGKCKAFDAAADGFVRSEGCGVVVLKRLSDALADGDPILAVIRGSAINQDGRSNGLTAPNGPSQEAVLRAALADARLTPDALHYVEAHGTGTALGDPIEAQALGAVLGERGEAGPLLVGSVKTNLGHLEAAAGIAGLLKVVLMLGHGQIPASLHFATPSPHIPWERLPITVPTTLQPWPAGVERRIAGVSSFGFSGTNVHIILESAPETDRAPTEIERSRHVIKLAAMHDDALRQYARELAAALGEKDAPALVDVAHTLNVARSDLPRRAAIVAGDIDEARTGLLALAAGESSDQVKTGFAGQRPPAVAFLFTGQGAQYPGMGRQLYDEAPVFRAVIDRCAEILEPLLDHGLLELLFAEPGSDEAALLDDTRYTQPALFALEYALAELWQSWGITPSAVAGHSLGEFVAACVAGVLSLEDGLRLVTMRGRLMASLPPGGAMAAAFASEERVIDVLGNLASEVSFAAINGPDSVVISASDAVLEAAAEKLRGASIEARLLAIPLAAHSPMVEPILDAFEREARAATYGAPQIDLVSGLTGKRVDATEIDAAYWRRQLREPVRYFDCVRTLIDEGHTVFVEIGPHPTLLGMARQFIPDEAVTAPSLRRDRAPWDTMLDSLGTLYVAGAPVDWKAFDRPYAARRIVLPTYPFQRERYWHPALTARRRRQPGDGPASLLGRRLLSPGLENHIFETVLATDQPAFLADHRIHGVVVLPSPAYLEILRAAGQESLGQTCNISNFEIHEALVLPDDGERIVQAVLTPHASGADAAIYSRSDGEDLWRKHATARLEAAGDSAALDEQADIAAIRDRCNEALDATAFYDHVAGLGLEFGASFRGLREIYRRDGEALGLMQLPENIAREAGTYGIHPALLDSCFHLLGATLPEALQGRTYLMIAIDHFRLLRQPGTVLWNHATLREVQDGNGETFDADVRLYDDEGSLVAEALGLQLKLASPEALARIVQRQSSDLLYEVSWQPAPETEPSSESYIDSVAVAGQARDRLDHLAGTHGLDVYANLLPELDQLCAGYVVNALSELGARFEAGQLLDAATLIADHEIQPRYQRLLERLLAMLAEDGILRPNGAAWEVATVREVPDDLADRVADLLARFPDTTAEIALTARCGAALAGVLRGEADPLQLLFPDGSLAPLEQLYGEAPFARVFNGLVAEAIAQAVAGLPPERPIRVLEIGAGTGATTRAALGALPADRVEYWFTDVSPLFLEHARERFGDQPGMCFKLFDLEQDPAAQEIPCRMFDLVIAANVVHATTDLRRSIEHAQRLLTPGGLLLLLEGARPQRWVDLTFGLTDGWWSFSDTELRPSYPLIGRDAWTTLLAEQGFDQPQVVGCSPDSPVDQTLIVAGAPRVTEDRFGDWLLIPDSTGVSANLATLLGDRGYNVTTMGDTEAIAAWLDGRGDPARPVRAVYLAALDTPPADAAAEHQFAVATRLSTDIVNLVRMLSTRTGASSLRVVTRGAQPAAGPNCAPLQATLWGIGRVVALEHPEIWGGLIDLDPAADAGLAAGRLLSALDISDGEDQVALRGDQRLVPRLVPTQVTVSEPLQIRDDSSYLVVGGTGGLGLKVARWLAESGARHITLTARTALPPRNEWTGALDGRRAAQVKAISEIEALGTEVEVAAADTADREQMTALVQRFGDELPPLRGIIHVAAHLGAYSLDNLPAEEIAAMLRPKLAGTLMLHELTRGCRLDFFALFSSTTALWGSSRMAHYAAANTFMDAFAHWRRSAGLPALSINWGTWDEMRVATADERQFVSDFGLNPLPSELALSTLEELLGTSRAQVAVAAVDWQRLKPAYEARRERPFLALVGGQPQQRPRSVLTATGEPARPDLLARLESVRPEHHRETVAGFVQSEVARTLGTQAGRLIDPQQGLFQLGMDSLMAVDLKGRLEAGIGKPLPATVVFNHPTIDALTSFLLDEIAGPAGQAESLTVPANGAASQDQAVPSPGDLDELSEDDLERLLAQRLARL